MPNQSPSYTPTFKRKKTPQEEQQQQKIKPLGQNPQFQDVSQTQPQQDNKTDLPNANTKFVINPDGSQVVTFGGVTRELSKEEAQGLRTAQGAPRRSLAESGEISQDVKDLIAAQNEARVKAKLSGNYGGASRGEQTGFTPEEQVIADRIAQEQQAGLIPIADQVGQFAPVEEQQTSILGNPKGLAASVGSAIVGGATTGATTGALSGLATGGVLSAPAAGVGALIGGVTAGVGAFITKISLEHRDNVKEAYANYRISKSNIGKIISAVNRGQITPEQAVIAYNEELRYIEKAYKQLRGETATDLKKYLSGGKDELVTMEGFRRQIPFLNQQMQLAILKPNPNTNVFLDDLENAE